MSISSASFSARANIYDAKMHPQKPPEPKQPPLPLLQPQKSASQASDTKVSVSV
jgi:hypothetical protein